MFKPEWWQYWDQPGRFSEIYQSWDLSFKDGDGNDYVVGLVAGRTGAHIHILDRFKAKVSFVETLHAIRQMRAKYPETRAVLIEDAANGPAVVSALHKEIRGILAVTPEGGKQSRAAGVQPQIESGQVFLPRPRFADGQLRFDYAWVEDFIEQCSIFPKGEYDDDVDALTQLLVYLQKRPVGLSPRARFWPSAQMIATMMMTMMTAAGEAQEGLTSSGALALLSNHGKSPIDPPSKDWLGHDSDRDRVCSSGMWNQNHIDEVHDPQFLDTLDQLVRKMARPT